MSQTNSWSSKEWFKASKEHFNNVKSSLPTADKQTGINVVVSGAFATAYSYETPVLKIPGQLGAAPVEAVVGAGTWAAQEVGERTAFEKEMSSENTIKVDYKKEENQQTAIYISPPEKKEVYQWDENNQHDLSSLNTRDNAPEEANQYNAELTKEQITELQKDTSVNITHHTHTTVTPEIKNNQTKDWETAGKWAEKASGAAVTAGAGIGCYAFSKGITTAGNSLLEGKSVLESFGNGVHAAKATVENAAYGAIEVGAAAVDLGVGSAILCVEAAGWVGGKIWDYTAGQLPHDEQSSIEIAGEAVVDATN